jgi:hypothetical protein
MRRSYSSGKIGPNNWEKQLWNNINNYRLSHFDKGNTEMTLQEVFNQATDKAKINNKDMFIYDRGDTFLICEDSNSSLDRGVLAYIIKPSGQVVFVDG